MKKIVLAAVNAKYIHSNLAVYSLKAYAEKEAAEACKKISIEIAEYTINQQPDFLLEDIYKKKPDILCFSCYIWNIQMISLLLPEIRKVLAETKIWLGGPEVSYDAAEVLERFPQADGVMRGEGEETFAALVRETAAIQGTEQPDLRKVDGITYRDTDGQIIETPWREPADMNQIPFVYHDMAGFENKIIYYESSRGCPFSCSYCLSSIDKKLRFRNLELVKKELQFFLDQKTRQVKFVDRTFNCKRSHAMAIWQYIRDHDNGITNFHFEISADLLDEQEICLIKSMRPGLIQLEIGVQSANPETIREIRRTMNLPQVEETVRSLKKGHNVHQHLDLIAGLPFEGLESFAHSFDRIYSLRPDQLQLGFLKVLKGSHMETMKEAYGLLCRETPPYEVLSTRWLSYDGILVLKGVEEMTEVYYNSGQFKTSLMFLEKHFNSPFRMYKELAGYYESHGLNQIQHSRQARYEILLSFVHERWPEEEDQMKECLIYDYYLRENAKSRPAFAGEPAADRRLARGFYEEEAQTHRYLEGYEAYDKNQIRRMTHLEYFPLKKEWVLFDYKNRDPLTHDGRGILIAKGK